MRSELVCRQANQHLEQAFDLPPGGAIGRTLADLLGDRMWPDAAEHVNYCLEGFEVSFELSPPPRRRSGERLWLFSLAPLFGPEESISGLILVVADHTGRRRLENDYRITLQLTRMLADHDQAMICRLDKDLRHRFANLAYRVFYHRTEADLFGRSLADVLGPAEYNALEDRLDAARAGREISLERTFTSPAGAEVELFATLYPLMDQNGRNQGLILRLAPPDQARDLPGEAWRYEIWRPADRSELDELTKQLLAACEGEWLARGFKKLIRLRTAVREAVLNAYEHGNKQDAAKAITLGRRFGSRFHLTIEDQGAGFDPDALPDPTAPENLLRERGRGVYLIKAATDQATWLKDGRKVHLSFKPDSTTSPPD